MSPRGIARHGLALAAVLASAADIGLTPVDAALTVAGFGRMCGTAGSARTPGKSRDGQRDCPAACHASCLRQVPEEDDGSEPPATS
jgi:uncharacterized membrane protein